MLCISFEQHSLLSRLHLENICWFNQSPNCFIYLLYFSNLLILDFTSIYWNVSNQDIHVTKGIITHNFPSSQIKILIPFEKNWIWEVIWPFNQLFKGKSKIGSLFTFLLQILRAIYPQRASAFWLIGQSSHMEVSWNNLALIETLENYARYIIPLKWSLVCGMNEIFMGQFFVIFNFLFIFLLQTGRFLLGSMHVALDFQILTGDYLRLIHFIIPARVFFLRKWNV